MARTSRPALASSPRGAAGRDELDAELGEAAGEVDDAALVGDREQRAADPDGAGLRERLERPVEDVLGDAPSIREARASERPRAGTPAATPPSRTRRCRAMEQTTRTTDPEHELERTGDELEERLERARRPHRRGQAGGRRRAARRRLRSRTPRATGGRRRRRRRRGRRGLRRPGGRRGRRRGLASPAPRLDQHAPRVRGSRRTAPAAISATASRQQLVLERAQRRVHRRRRRVASGSSTAPCRMIGPVSTPSSTKWTVTPKTFTP